MRLSSRVLAGTSARRMRTRILEIIHAWFELCILFETAEQENDCERHY